jgi:hypothetical protein
MSKYIDTSSTIPLKYCGLCNISSIWPKETFLERFWKGDLSHTSTSFKLTPFQTEKSGSLKESESVYINTTFRNFYEWYHGNLLEVDNPFYKVPKRSESIVSVYAAYMYFSELAIPDSISNLFDWTSLIDFQHDLFSTVDITNPTCWLGTMNSYTPLHYDTYGCNVVIQLVGTKKWLLWKLCSDIPSTRIPYEESTVYSAYDPLLSSAHIPADVEIELNAGDVLFVPKHYWHFVQTTSDISLAINLWLPLESDKLDRYTEAITKLVMKSFVSELQISQSININELVSPSEIDDMPCMHDDDGMNMNYVTQALQDVIASDEEEEISTRLKKLLDALLNPTVIRNSANASLS